MRDSPEVTNFYTHMLRNLSVLRDIQRIITEARDKRQNEIIFRDENGQRWMLKRIPVQKPNPAPPPLTQGQTRQRHDSRPWTLYSHRN